MGRKLYDLVGEDPACRFSPFCWRSRLALAHKGLDVETILEGDDVDISEFKAKLKAELKEELLAEITGELEGALNADDGTSGVPMRPDW